MTLITNCVSFVFSLLSSADEKEAFTLASVFPESANCSELIATLRLDLKFVGSFESS